MPSTRSSFTCSILGAPRSLPQCQPTYKDVLLACFEEQYNNVHIKKLSPKIPILDIAKVVATNVVALYKKATIPAISYKTVTERIVSFHKEYDKLMKSYQNKSRHGTDGLNTAINKFVDK